MIDSRDIVDVNDVLYYIEDGEVKEGVVKYASCFNNGWSIVDGSNEILHSNGFATMKEAEDELNKRNGVTTSPRKFKVDDVFYVVGYFGDEMSSPYEILKCKVLEVLYDDEDRYEYRCLYYDWNKKEYSEEHYCFEVDMYTSYEDLVKKLLDDISKKELNDNIPNPKFKSGDSVVVSSEFETEIRTAKIIEPVQYVSDSVRWTYRVEYDSNSPLWNDSWLGENNIMLLEDAYHLIRGK